ncbi:MAG: TlpA disulfide reductase family protein [Bacteroidota bacterium]
MQRLFFICLTVIGFMGISSCFVMENAYDTVAPGYWRGSLQILPPNIPIPDDDEAIDRLVEDVSTSELPFVFEIKYDVNNNNRVYVEFLNGKERITTKDVLIGHNRATGRDSIRIDFPIYETYIIADYESNIMNGFFVDESRGNYRIPFKAKQGQNHRFTTLRKEPKLDLSGRWETTFDLESDEPYKAVGEFVQKGNNLRGTFRTETGDYRFLEGTVQGNKAFLSVFDGAHAFLFEAKIQEDGTLIGAFRSGTHYKTTWEARRNSEFELTNPHDLTFLKEGYDRVEFSFENTEGKMVSLDDSAFQNKVKIVQIFGSWCPNCRDETEFLTEYLRSKSNDELAVVALAFERRKDKEKALNVLRTYKEKMNIPYDLLLAGSSNKKEAAKALPMLNHILSYPTMIFIDRQNKVRRIHTGFNGPATSKFPQFRDEFDEFVQSLLAEKPPTSGNT